MQLLSIRIISKYRILIPTLLTMCFVQCGTPDKNDNSLIEGEIEQLVTDEQKRVFLENIHEQDQYARKKLNEIEVQYGYDSEERKQAIHTMMQTDVLNLQKIELYLEKYGHPTIEKHGANASGAPWIVIHHSRNIEARERNFISLYDAYKKRDIRPGSFVFYLDRFHIMKFNNRFTLPNPYKEEDVINELIKRLELDTLIK